MTPSKPRILLVDDLPANLHTLSAALAKDYDLSIATSGVAALQLAREIRPNLILLDLMMPGMDGLEMLAMLRSNEWGREIPVIMVTADDRTETLVSSLDQGADDFIAKPVVIPVVQARVRNLLERQRLRHELFRMATVDELTGALNRRYFFERGEVELTRSQRYGHPCGVLMLDIDHFKLFNDQHGHAVGDRVLQAFSRCVKTELRDSDILGRIGGEEFAVLSPHSDRAGSLKLGERLREVVADMRMPLDSGDTPGTSNASDIATALTVTASIGVTQFNPSDTRLDASLQRADSALYAAKESGRNRVCEAT